MAIGGHRKTTAHSGDGWLAPVGPGTRRLASTADVAALRERVHSDHRIQPADYFCKRNAGTLGRFPDPSSQGDCL